MLQRLFTLESRFTIYLFSQRRNFIPILSIYFLTLSNTTAQQIWVFMSLGFLASFLLEIPSAYFADRFWHKKTLILSKVLQWLSLFFFIGASFVDSHLNYYIFILWSITQAFGFSFFSGTTSAYFHWILERTGRGKDFGKIMAKLKWKVSLICAIMIVLLPFLTTIDILVPLIVSIWVDIIGFFFLLSLPDEKKVYEIKKSKNILEILKEARISKALHVSIYVWVILWFLVWENAYRSVYLESLGYPIILIGMVMWLSRLVWFIVWHYAHYIETLLTMRQLFLFEIMLFPLFIAMISYFDNPYLVWILLSIIIWYQHGRKAIIEWFIINNYITDPRYKATVLSLQSFINSLTSTLVSFFIWFVMIYSYKLWYAVLSFSLFFLMVVSFYYIFRSEKKV